MQSFMDKVLKIPKGKLLAVSAFVDLIRPTLHLRSDFVPARYIPCQSLQFPSFSKDFLIPPYLPYENGLDL